MEMAEVGFGDQRVDRGLQGFESTDVGDCQSDNAVDDLIIGKEQLQWRGSGTLDVGARLPTFLKSSRVQSEEREVNMSLRRRHTTRLRLHPPD